jgi:flavin reductase (DIM6/NTAB) family NADH-FMN oxidoreductase RutF
MQHDTWINVHENGEFVVNLVGEPFGPLMETMEKDFPYGVSEIQECGLTEVKANNVKPPRIGEAFGWFECRMVRHVPLSDRNVWIIGQILEVAVKDNTLDDVVRVETARPLNHIWGEAFVTQMRITRFRRA